MHVLLLVKMHALFSHTILANVKLCRSNEAVHFLRCAASAAHFLYYVGFLV